MKGFNLGWSWCGLVGVWWECVNVIVGMEILFSVVGLGRRSWFDFVGKYCGVWVIEKKKEYEISISFYLVDSLGINL